MARAILPTCVRRYLQIMMFRLLVAALCVSSTAAFTPAPMASRVSMSRVAAQMPTPVAPEPVATRAAAVSMNADGEHETLYEM